MSKGAKKRLRSGVGQISEAAWAFLNDKLTDDIGLGWERWGLEADQVLFDQGIPVRGLWKQYGPAVLTRWQSEQPGTRPALWWRFDAPRLARGAHPDCFWDGTLPEPRKRVGGIGTPLHEILAYVPSFYLGVPKSWIGADEQHSCSIETAAAIDPQNPPTFESQASYLERLGLFSRGERARLSASAFAPESVLDALRGMRVLSSDSAQEFEGDNSWTASRGPVSSEG